MASEVIWRTGNRAEIDTQIDIPKHIYTDIGGRQSANGLILCHSLLFCGEAFSELVHQSPHIRVVSERIVARQLQFEVRYCEQPRGGNYVTGALT